MSADTALRAIFTLPRAGRACPTVPELPTTLTPAEKKQAAALMRVNHAATPAEHAPTDR